MANNLPELLGATEIAKLAEHAANALRRMILLQRPWGEFRELIPQSLETLASRGREAEQYTYVAKPKIFASFEVIRTLKLLMDGPLNNCIRRHFDRAVTEFGSFLKDSFVTGIRKTKEGGVWIADFRLDMPRDHTGSRNLQRAKDFRHTAEGVHFLLQFGEATVMTAIPHADASITYKDIIIDLLTDFQKKIPNSANKHALAEIVHLFNLLRHLKHSCNDSKLLEAIETHWSAVEARLAEERASPEGMWLTGELGPVWGTSFVLHLLKTTAPSYEEALQALSTALQELTKLDLAGRRVETELQAFLVLAETGLLTTDGTHAQGLRDLVKRLDWESMELGEAAYTVQ